jgi:hypothetical protein
MYFTDTEECPPRLETVATHAFWLFGNLPGDKSAGISTKSKTLTAVCVLKFLCEALMAACSLDDSD